VVHQNHEEEKISTEIFDAEWFIRTAKIGLCLPSCCRGFANLSNHEDEKNSSEFFEADMREKRSGSRSKNFVLLLSQV